jgi:hypothetical protein
VCIGWYFFLDCGISSTYIALSERYDKSGLYVHCVVPSSGITACGGGFDTVAFSHSSVRSR